MADFTFELAPPPGIFSDDTTFGAKGSWADGSNIRFRGGRPETIGRIVRILGSGAFPTAASPRALFAFISATLSSVPFIVVGGDAALFTSAGSASSIGNDISPVGLGSGISYWAFDSWGDTLMAAPKAGSLYTSTGASVAAVVTQAPAAMNHMIVTAQRQVLALGCNEEISTTFNPMCVRWCDLENYTNWTSTNTNNAGEYILEGEGKIVAGRRIGAYVAIWTNAALHLAQFIGDPSQTYRFDLVSGGCGLIGPGGVTVENGIAYWMSPEHRFYRWSPGALPEQIPCPISRDLQENIAAGASRADQRTIATRNTAFGEIWWFYPDTRDVATGGYRYVAYSTLDGTWFRGGLDRRAAYHGDFLFNPTASGSVRAWRPFISIDGNGALYSHEVEAFGGTGDGVASPDYFIQSADQYVNSGRTRVMIQGVKPDFEQQATDVALTLYMRDRPQSTAVTKGPYTLTAASNKKDFRASGMLMSVKISTTSVSGAQFRIGKPTFDCVTMGER